MVGNPGRGRRNDCIKQRAEDGEVVMPQADLAAHKQSALAIQDKILAIQDKIKERLSDHSGEHIRPFAEHLGLLAPMTSRKECQYFLIGSLKGQNRDAALSAIYLLQAYTSEDSARTLGDISIDTSQPVKLRVRAILALESISGQDTVRNLLSNIALGDDSPLIRYSAIQALTPKGRVICGDTIKLLKEIANKDVDPKIRYRATIIAGEPSQQYTYTPIKSAIDIKALVESMPQDIMPVRDFKDALSRGVQLPLSSFLRQTIEYLIQDSERFNPTILGEENSLNCLMQAVRTCDSEDRENVLTLIEQYSLRILGGRSMSQIITASTSEFSPTRFPLLVDRSNPNPYKRNEHGLSAEDALAIMKTAASRIGQDIKELPFRPILSIPEMVGQKRQIYGLTLSWSQRLERAKGAIKEAMRELSSVLSRVEELSTKSLNRLEIYQILSSIPCRGLAKICPKKSETAALKEAQKRISYLQRQVGDELLWCHMHLRHLIDASSNSRNTPESAIETEIIDAHEPPIGRAARQFILCAAASVADRISTTSQTRGVILRLLEEFPSAAEPILDNFIPSCADQPEYVAEVLLAIGEHISDHYDEAFMPTDIGMAWLKKMIECRVPIPNHLQVLALGNTTSPSLWENETSPSYKAIFKPFVDMCARALTYPVPERVIENGLQAALTICTIEMGIFGQDRFLQDKAFQTKLLQITQSEMPLVIKRIASFVLSSYGRGPYSGAQLNPTILKAILNGASEEEDPVKQVFYIQAIPEQYLTTLCSETAPSNQENGSAAATKKIQHILNIATKSTSRDTRLETCRKLLPLILNNDARLEFVRLAILKSLGSIKNREYLLNEIKYELHFLLTNYDWASAAMKDGWSDIAAGKLSPEILGCYELIGFLIAHEHSSDPDIASGADFLLGEIIK